MVTQAQAQAALVREGQLVTLKRVTTGQVPSTASAHAVVRNYRPQELVNGVMQGDIQVRVSALDLTTATWPTPPKKNDHCIIEGRTYTVQGVDSVWLRGDTVAYVLQVRG